MKTKTKKKNVVITATRFHEVGLLVLLCRSASKPGYGPPLVVLVAGDAADTLRSVLTSGKHVAIEYEPFLGAGVVWLVRFAVSPYVCPWLTDKEPAYGPPFGNMNEYTKSGYVHIRPQLRSMVAAFPPGYVTSH